MAVFCQRDCCIKTASRELFSQPICNIARAPGACRRAENHGDFLTLTWRDTAFARLNGLGTRLFQSEGVRLACRLRQVTTDVNTTASHPVLDAMAATTSLK